MYFHSYDITNQAGSSQTLASADGAINVAFSAFLK